MKMYRKAAMIVLLTACVDVFAATSDESGWVKFSEVSPSQTTLYRQENSRYIDKNSLIEQSVDDVKYITALAITRMEGKEDQIEEVAVICEGPMALAFSIRKMGTIKSGGEIVFSVNLGPANISSFQPTNIDKKMPDNLFTKQAVAVCALRQ